MVVKREGVEEQPLSFIADFNGRRRGVRRIGGMQNESSIFGHGNSPTTWTFLSSYNAFKNLRRKRKRIRKVLISSYDGAWDSGQGYLSLDLAMPECVMT